MNPFSAKRAIWLPRRLTHWIEASISWVYPEFCRVCHAEPATAADGFVGNRCHQDHHKPSAATCGKCGAWILGAVEAPSSCSNCRGRNLQFEFARSATLAQGTPNAVIQRYKYHGDLYFEPYLGKLMGDWARQELSPSDWNAVLATPLHPKKRRRRGFNQADILAKAVSHSLGVPLLTHAARRRRHTPTQTSLSRDQRIANLEGAFEARRPNRIPKGAAILIVDDVLTTGATMNALASALLDAGAGRVAAISLARGV